MENIDRISYLGHELEVGNSVQFDTSGMTLRGKILDFEGDKAVIQTRSCLYKTEEELEKIKAKAKRQYKIRCAKCILLVPAGTYGK